MSDDKNIRHRFTVPAADTSVNEWIETQSNLGFSLRVLIKAFIRDYGIRDATCMALGEPVKAKGRPPKNATLKLGGFGNAETTASSEEDVVSDPETGDEQNIPVQARETTAPVQNTIPNTNEMPRKEPEVIHKEPVAKPLSNAAQEARAVMSADGQIDMNSLNL